MCHNLFSARDVWSRDELNSALQCNQFVPYFQPQIDLATGAPVCMEALARWNHPDLGTIQPSEFVQQMEEGELIDDLTLRLLDQTLNSIQQLNLIKRGIGFAINVSPLTLQNIEACKNICSLVSKYGICPRMITIEVTETACNVNSRQSLASLNLFRLYGFNLSADDFGIGYSSLQELNRMPFTEIKIDRMFVAGISLNAKAEAILEAIVSLACKLKMRTVAEGIERVDELRFVESLGCDLGQGYFFGAPMPYCELPSYLHSFRTTKTA